MASVARIIFPYCLQEQKDGTWIVLNRDYKPIGFHTSEHIRYEDYPIAIKFKHLSDSLIKQIAVSGKKTDNAIYLYADDCVPTRNKRCMISYLQRLEILMKRQIR